MVLYVKALNEELAAGIAEVNAFAGTTALRKCNSGWVTDDTTMMVTNGDPIVVSKLPDESYKKEPLIKAFGEDSAIDFLNAAVDSIHE